jgi:tetratricopeptide (TPR) repeat protein
VQARRRLDFMANKWSVSVDEYWADVRTFVERHRYYPYLESIALLPGQARAELMRFAEGFDPSDIELRELDLVHQLRKFGVPLGNHLFAFCQAHCESAVDDLAAMTLSMPTNRKVNLYRNILAMSPYSAFAMAGLVESDWDAVKDGIAAWREKVQDNPTLLGALGKKYAELKRYGEAETCLERYMVHSPDRWAYEALAACYEARGAHDRWKATLDEYLAKTEDAGLEHAKVRVQIAEDLMRNSRYAEARPYADAAAQTWAGWAMSCAEKCAEGQEDWEAAEGWARASTERYPGTMWAVWFLFCERTGHGDVAAARATTKEFAADLLDNPDLSADDLLLISYVQYLCGDPEKATAALRRISAEQDNPIYVTAMAAVSDLAGETEIRDAALTRFCTALESKAPKSAKILQLIRDAIARKEPGKLDLRAIDGIIESIPADRRGNTAFPVAAHLTANGQLDAARQYWLMVSEGKETNYWWRVFALSTLRERYPQAPDKGTRGEKDGVRKKV